MFPIVPFIKSVGVVLSPFLEMFAYDALMNVMVDAPHNSSVEDRLERLEEENKILKTYLLDIYTNRLSSEQTIIFRNTTTENMLDSLQSS
jgi:hypothetical protein